MLEDERAAVGRERGKLAVDAELLAPRLSELAAENDRLSAEKIRVEGLKKTLQVCTRATELVT